MSRTIHGAMPAAGTALRIGDAKAIAAAHGLQAAMILGVRRDGTVQVVTYGQDRARCDAIGDWAKGLWRHAISAVPFQTRFGWGKGGVPTPLTPTEFGSLSEGGKAFARRHGGEP